MSLPRWPEQARKGEHLVHGVQTTIDGVAVVIQVFLDTSAVLDIARVALANDGNIQLRGLRVRVQTRAEAQATAEAQDADLLERQEKAREKQAKQNRRGKEVTG